MEVIKLFKGITRYIWLIRRYPKYLVDEVISEHPETEVHINESYVMDIIKTGDKERDIYTYLLTNKPN